MEGGSEFEGVWVGGLGSVVRDCSVWGGGMFTSGGGDDGGLGCESGGGGGGGDDGGGGVGSGEEGLPDPGGDGEWCWGLWSEERISSSGGTW